jgi:hypothetical protein
MRERLYRVITGRVGEELQTRRATLLLDAGACGGGGAGLVAPWWVRWWLANVMNSAVLYIYFIKLANFSEIWCFIHYT